MTTCVALTEWDEAYSGLRHTSIKVQGLTLKVIENSQAWQKMRRIGGGAPGIFDDIANFLRNLLSYLRPWDLFQWLRWRVFDPLMSFMNWTFLDRLRNLFRPIIDHLRDVLAYWINLVRGAINTLRDRVISALHSLPTSLYWFFQGIFNAIRLALEGFRALFGWLVGKLPEWIRAPIRQMWETITHYMRLSWEVWGGLVNNLKVGIQASIGILTTLIHNPLETIRALWQIFVQSWQGGLLRSIWDSLQNLWNAIIEALRQVWARVHPIILEAAETAMVVARPYVTRWVGAFESVPATFLNWVAATAGSNLALQPSRALATAGSLYAMSIAAGAAAMTVATVLNVIPATNWVGAQQFAAFISEAAGFEPLTRATYGTLLNEVLIWPLRYHWNMQLRPRLPTEGALLLMGRKRGLSEGEWRTAMAYQGIPDWYLDKIYLFNWSDPSPFWVSRVTEAHIPDWRPDATWARWADEWMPGWRNDPFRWVRAKLLLAGYERADVDSMIEAIHAKLLASSITQVKTGVRAMLREAYWDRRDAEAALRPMDVRQEEIELLLVAEELDYQKRYLDDDVRYFKEQFRKGELSLQDLRLALSTIIVRSERVEQEVSRERVRALKKPKSIVPVKENPLVKSLRRQAVSAWAKRYRDWEIDEEELRLGFTIVVEDADLALEMVRVERLRPRPPPPPPPPPPEDPLVVSLRRQVVNSWVARYRKWEIDERELLMGLTIVLLDPDLAGELVEVEKTRVREPPVVPPPPPEDPEVARSRRAAIASWVDRFRKEEIDARELEIGLGPLIDDLEVVDEIVELEELRAEIPPPPLVPIPEDPVAASSRRQAIASWVDQFRKGEIDAELLEIVLLPLIEDAEVVRLVTQLEQLRYLPTPELVPLVDEDPNLARVRTETVRGHLAMFQKRLIWVEQLYSFLLADGLVEALARATVITQATKRVKVPRLDSPYFLRDVMRELVDQGLLAYEEMFIRREISIDEFTTWLTAIPVDPDVVTYLADTLTLRRFLEDL